MAEYYDGLSAKPFHIILVEDDDGDAKAVRRAFAHAKVANPIIRVEDGIQALALLNGDGDRKPPPKPYLLLVDLNVPRMNGLELIRAVREHPQLSRTIIFVLTTSKREEDKNAAYDLNVAGYIVKETAGKDFLELSHLLDSYWKIVELPD